MRDRDLLGRLPRVLPHAETVSTRGLGEVLCLQTCLTAVKVGGTVRQIQHELLHLVASQWLPCGPRT